MAGWSRDTPWRQGHVLPSDAATALSLLSAESSNNNLVVVVSHDCDLASDSTGEPYVEAIIAKRIEKADGNCTYSKNARKLHLEFSNQDDRVFVELQATAKIYVSKEQLEGVQPHPDICLDANGRTLLQRWLAARYHRAAFPDEFDQRLKNVKLDKKLAKILEPCGNFIRAILFDVDGGEEVARNGATDTYSLDIMVVHTTDPDPDEGFEVAKKVCDQIKSAFKSKLYDDNGWSDIELRDCFPMSDEALTVRESEYWKEWRLEYMSLRQELNKPMMGE